MPLPLLRQKLALPPTWGEFVARPRLAETLDQALASGQHVALFAGSGYGKTALVADWCRHRPHAWVTLDAEDAALDVSLTDRAGWAVCLVGPEGTMASGTLGVDLEIVEDRSATFVADYFTPAEQAFIHGCGAPGSDGWAWSANLLWSAKEAALKVLRVGLRADTRSVEVTLDLQARPDGWAALSIAAPSGEAFPGWWRRDGVYLLTLAARVPHQPPARLDGGSDLAHGIPTHSWIGRPLVQ